MDFVAVFHITYLRPCQIQTPPISVGVALLGILRTSEFYVSRDDFPKFIIIIIIFFFFHGLGLLTCSGIGALPSFLRSSTISSSSRFVFEGVFRQSGVVHSFKMVDPILFPEVQFNLFFLYHA